MNVSTFRMVPVVKSPLFVPAVFALLLLVIYVIYSRAFTKSSKKRRTILLLGTSDSGKTAILTSFVHNQTYQTHTSLQSNTSILPIPINTDSQPKHIKLYNFIDIPGHPRLRTTYVSHLPQTHTILFVIDTSTIARSASPGSAILVAEFLHQILYQLALVAEESARKGRKSGDAIKLVLVAHKVDLVTTGSGVGGKPLTKGEIGINRIRTILERELTKRSNNLKQSVGIEGLGSEEPKSPSGADVGMIDSSSGLTGLECTNNPVEGFKFAAWEYGEVEFVSSWVSVLSEEYDDEIGQTSSVETVDSARQQEGLVELKDWLNGNLS